jgi:hypothetical protein
MSGCSAFVDVVTRWEAPMLLLLLLLLPLPFPHDEPKYG